MFVMCTKTACGNIFQVKTTKNMKLNPNQKCPECGNKELVVLGEIKEYKGGGGLFTINFLE